MAVLVLACSAPQVPVSNATSRHDIHPLFVVPVIAHQPYLLACSIGGALVDGKACAPRLRGTLDLERFHVSGDREPIRMDARFELGFPCPGPVDLHDESKPGDQPFVRMTDVPSGASLLVPRGTHYERGLDAVLSEVHGPNVVYIENSTERREVIGIVDLDGHRLIVTRNTELYAIYSPDGTQLPGEVGCYFGG
jgi:hypothetical protein